MRIDTCFGGASNASRTDSTGVGLDHTRLGRVLSSRLRRRPIVEPGRFGGFGSHAAFAIKRSD